MSNAPRSGLQPTATVPELKQRLRDLGVQIGDEEDVDRSVLVTLLDDMEKSATSGAPPPVTGPGVGASPGLAGAGFKSLLRGSAAAAAAAGGLMRGVADKAMQELAHTDKGPVGDGSTYVQDCVRLSRTPPFLAAALAMRNASNVANTTAQHVPTATRAPATADDDPSVRTRRVQINETVDGIEVTAQEIVSRRVILYFHGGAHLSGSAGSHPWLMGNLSTVARARVVSVNYRLAPQNPFPKGLEDALESFRWVREKHPGASIVVAGDSAGGNLAFALIVKLAQLAEAMPAACVGLSPWLLLDPDRVAEVRGERHAGANRRWGDDTATAIGSLVSSLDVHATMTKLTSGRLHDLAAACYFQAHNPSNPLISPILADEGILGSFPPIVIHADEGEPLAADARMMVDQCRAAGVAPVSLEMYKDTAHVFQAFPKKYSQAACDSIAKIASFLEPLW
eukprot:TRINITY_DN74482_c0_g1_i1.p1 TRINITY_DN74482_c0_g1~~TRINITY_DN74482_c0_g1_i1.p1  ORF type:complete len:465 (+),score=75.90 TRINITY_DN74482_c0_g1_i1:38-1396(+)